MELRPRLRARAPDDQTNGLARVPQREHEELGPAVLSGVRMAHHRSAAVVDLSFLAGSGRDDHAGFFRRAAAQLQHEATHARVAGAKPVAVDQVLPDAHRVATAASASAITSRKGSHALAPGARPGAGGLSGRSDSVDISGEMAGFAVQKSVDTPSEMAGFEGPGSADTPVEMAGFDCAAAGRPRPRTTIPAAFR